jgi:hypothetical protein
MHTVTGSEFRRTDAFACAVGADAFGERGREPREGVGEIAGTVARAQFEVAAEQKKNTNMLTESK